MKLTMVPKPVCQLARGEARRIPQRGTFVGVTLRCPFCGFRDDAPEGVVQEHPDGTVSARAMACHLCKRSYSVDHGDVK